MKQGRIALVAAGPGEPDLVTVRALSLIQSADVIFYDPLTVEILLLAPAGAARILIDDSASEGVLSPEEGLRRMAEAVRESKKVVRLLSGNPFGGGGTHPEKTALQKAGCPVEVVPGVEGGTYEAGDKRPLAGRSILITRAREQSGVFAQLLREQGARVFQVPTIRFAPPDSWERIDHALQSLSRYSLTLFTSANGVEGFFKRLNQQGADIRALHGTCLAAIGPKTAEALRERGLRVDLVPKEFVAEGLLQALEERDLDGTEVLIPRAQEARDILIVELEKRGARVTVAPVYRTVTATESRPYLERIFKEKEVDLVTFTATSTVNHLVSLLGAERFPDLLREVQVACIGPITAEAVRKQGLSVNVLPLRYTIPDLAEAITRHFSKS